MRTRPLILLACLAAAGCGGSGSNESATTRSARDVFTLTTTHVARHHPGRVHVTCRTATSLCRALEVVLQPPPTHVADCACPVITATVTVTGTLDGRPFRARRLTVCSGCGRSPSYRTALFRVLRAGGVAAATLG